MKIYQGYDFIVKLFCNYEYLSLFFKHEKCSCIILFLWFCFTILIFVFFCVLSIACKKLQHNFFSINKFGKKIIVTHFSVIVGFYIYKYTYICTYICMYKFMYLILPLKPWQMITTYRALFICYLIYLNIWCQ